jgi:hypothetical protein
MQSKTTKSKSTKTKTAQHTKPVSPISQLEKDWLDRQMYLQDDRAFYL